MNRPFHGRTRTAAAVVAAIALGVLAGCSSSSSSSTTAPATSPGSSSTAAASPPAASSSSTSASTTSTSSCGTKPGVAATGTPINIGAIDTKQPGTDFSDIENMAGADFAGVH